jgi:hypothetical protein
MGDNPIMKSATLDDRRRLVMPPGFPPNSAVTIQQLDRDTLIVKMHRDKKNYKVVLIPAIYRLTDDPEFDALQEKIAQHTSKHLPPFRE